MYGIRLTWLTAQRRPIVLPRHRSCAHGQASNSIITKTHLFNIQQFFTVLKRIIFQMKKVDYFLIFAQNIDRVPTLEPPQYEYPQAMFKSENKKTIYTPVNPSFTIYKSGV